MNDTPTNGNNQVATQPAKKVSAVTLFQHDMGNMESQFLAALPKHIPVERFMRVVQTAVMGNPDLLKAERKSLWQACMKAAQDGLLPDGREAALVARKSRQKVNGQWEDALLVTYQPMIAGVRKKARNSGEISTWDAHVVHENDHFVFQLGDDPRIEHSYDLKQERGKPVGAYSVCTLKDGTKSYEVMSLSDIYAIRNRSDGWKAFANGAIKSTPWSSDEGEMMRKTVAKRHSKVLPMSTDLDDLMRRDDELYNFTPETDEARQIAKPPAPKTLAGKLEALAGGGSREDDARAAGANIETGEVLDDGDDGQPAGGESTTGPGPEAGSGGNAAGQGSSPATPAPAAAKKRGPKPKDQAAAPPADPDAIPESLRRTEQPAPQPAPTTQPAPQQQAEPAASDEPEEDEDEQGDVAVLTDEEKKTLRVYHDSMTRAMSPAKLNAFHADIFPNTVGSAQAIETANLWYENTTYGRAVKALFDAHFDRVTEDVDITVADAVLKRLLG